MSARQGPLASANPAAGFLVAAMMFGVFVLNALLGTAAMNRVAGVVNLAIAVWLIAYRPFARSNPGIGFVDFGVGLLMLAGAWHMLGNQPG